MATHRLYYQVVTQRLYYQVVTQQLYHVAIQLPILAIIVVFRLKITNVFKLEALRRVFVCLKYERSTQTLISLGLSDQACECHLSN